MKKLYRSLIVLALVFVGFVQNANASHISGVDFSYTCVGQDSFLVTFNVFRDCSGVGLGSTAFVNFTSTCGGSVSASLTLQNGSTGTEVSQLCATSIVNSTCNGGTLPGMQQYIYTGIVVLAPSCNTWSMSWTSCCRNPGVINIVNPSSQSMWVDATMNSGTDSCNSSPVFNAQPIPYVCLNQIVNYNFGVTEPDGDSIVYSFVTPFGNNGTSPIPFAAGYTFNVPIPGITLNASTGQLTFTPTTLGNFVLAVKACEYEYGTGLLLGCVTRDIQFVVINCANTQPAAPPGGMSNFQGTGVQIGPDSVEVCVGNYFSFDLVFTDANVLDSITLFSNITAVLPGATVTTTNGNPATITVSWIAQPGTAPFNSFTVTGIDDACPTPGIAVASYNVIVVPSTYAGPDLTICQGTQWAQLGATGGSLFTWNVLSGSAIDTVPSSPTYNMTCKNCQYPQASPNVTTTYIVTSNLSGTCVNVDTVVVNVAPNFNLTMPNDTLICSVDDYPLVLTTSEPSFTYAYKWKPSATLDFDTVATPLANPSDPTVYTVTMTSAGGCKKIGSVFIDLSPPFPGNMQITGDTILCVGQTTQLNVDFGTVDVGSCGPTTQSCLGVVQDATLGSGTATNSSTAYPAVYGGQHYGAKHEILYRANELSNMGMGSGGLINSIAFYINTLSSVPAYTDFIIRVGCTSEVDLSGGWLNPYNMTTVYSNPSYTPNTGWNVHNFSTSFKWDGTSSLVFEICFNNFGNANNSVMPYTATGYQSVLYQVGNNSSICGTYSPAGGGATLSNKRPNTKFNFCSGVDPNALNFTWSPTNGLSNGIIPNPVAGPTVSTNYQLIVSDTFGGCSDTLNHFIDIVTQFNAGFVFNDPYCVSASPDTAFVFTGNGYFTGTGVDSAGVFSPGIAGVGVHPVTYHIPVPTLCANDSTIDVTVIPLPDASFQYQEVCIGGDTVTLTPVNTGGVFSGPGVIDGINGIFDPTGLSAGTYPVAYTLTQPCFNSDTIGVKVIEPYTFTWQKNFIEVCQDNTVNLSSNYILSNNPNQGNGPILAIWSDLNNYVDSATGVFDATGVPNGDYIITLTVAGMDGSCGSSKTMTVRVLKIDYPTFPDGLVYCDNEKNAIVQVAPWLFGAGTVYTQTPLGSLGPNDTLDIVAFGSNGKFDATKAPFGSWELTVSYTNLNGCTGVTTDTIYVLETPEAPSPNEAAYCEGEDIYLTATGTYPDSMYWYNDINLNDTVGVGSPTYWGVAPDPANGPVYVWVTQNNWECISPKVKYQLPIKVAPNADFTMTYTDTNGVVQYNIPHTQSPIYGFNPFSVNFAASNATAGADSVWWNHHAEEGINSSWVNDGNNHAAGFTYTVANLIEDGAVGTPYITRMIITNEFGCTDTSEALIWNIGTEGYYNIFTPNGDGVNDVFRVDNTSLKTFKVEIFNRWGAKVYEWENDYTRGWDGGDSPEGVYYWTLIGVYQDGTEFQKQGSVTLTGRNK